MKSARVAAMMTMGVLILALLGSGERAGGAVPSGLAGP